MKAEILSAGKGLQQSLDSAMPISHLMQMQRDQNPEPALDNAMVSLRRTRIDRSDPVPLRAPTAQLHLLIRRIVLLLAAIALTMLIWSVMVFSEASDLKKQAEWVWLQIGRTQTSISVKFAELTRQADCRCPIENPTVGTTMVATPSEPSLLLLPTTFASPYGTR